VAFEGNGAELQCSHYAVELRVRKALQPRNISAKSKRKIITKDNLARAP